MNSLRKAAEMVLEVFDNDYGQIAKDCAMADLRRALEKENWVGLTHDDRVQIHTMWVLDGRFGECLDATEEKLKEKNA